MPSGIEVLGEDDGVSCSDYESEEDEIDSDHEDKGQTDKME